MESPIARTSPYFLVLLFFAPCSAINPEAGMRTDQLIKYHGYPVEIHEAVTADGYVLQMHRIPHGREESGWTKRPVVLFVHGLQTSSACWVDNHAHDSAGFMFADAGFDVWLANNRGNLYSKNHTLLSATDKQFWNFTWYEMATRDLDAFVGKIAEVSGQQAVYVVAHSQGSTQVFARLAHDPAFAPRIRRLFALAPIARVHKIQGLFRLLAATQVLMEVDYKLGGDREYLQADLLTAYSSQVACTNPISDELCSSLVFMTAGPDVGLLNTTRLDVYTTNAPAGTSLKNMLHWTQLVNSGRFQTFDYGDPAQNFVHYGQTTPVAFNLRKIRVPVHLFLSDFDWLSTREDVEEFLLPNLRKTLAEVVRLPRFSHLDYIWGLTSGREIYAPIIESIKQLDGFE